MGENVVYVQFSGPEKGRVVELEKAKRNRLYGFLENDLDWFQQFRTFFERRFKDMLEAIVVPNAIQESVRKMSCDELMAFLQKAEVSEIVKNLPRYFAVYKRIMCQMGEWEEDLDDK